MEVEDSKKLDGKLMGRAAGRGFTKPAGEMVDGVEFFKPTKGENHGGDAIIWMAFYERPDETVETQLEARRKKEKASAPVDESTVTLTTVHATKLENAKRPDLVKTLPGQDDQFIEFRNSVNSRKAKALPKAPMLVAMKFWAEKEEEMARRNGMQVDETITEAQGGPVGSAETSDGLSAATPGSINIDLNRRVGACVAAWVP